MPVYYVTEDGQQLDFQYASCLTNATTQVYANSSVVPWDYLLVKPASGVVDVFVDSMGNASPSEVRFVYAVPEQPTEAPTEVPTEAPTEPPVIQAEVTVLYQLDDNGTILDTQYVMLNQGDNYVTANSAMTAGYQLVGEDTVHVWVDNGGTASVNPVVFHYATPQPVTSNIDVFYYHENGTLLDQQSQTLTEGVNYIYAASDRVGGYDLISENPQTVTLRPDGTTDLASVSFFYADPQPTEVNVPVHYLNSEGEPVAMDDTLTLGEGTHLCDGESAGHGGRLCADARHGKHGGSERFRRYRDAERGVFLLSYSHDGSARDRSPDGHARPADDAGGDSLLRHERRGNCRPGGEGTAAGDVSDDSGARNPRLRAGQYPDAV